MIWKQVVLSLGGVIRSINPFFEFFKKWDKDIRKVRHQKGRKSNTKDVK